MIEQFELCSRFSLTSWFTWFTFPLRFEYIGFLDARPINVTSHGPLEHHSLCQFEGDDETASCTSMSFIVFPPGAYHQYAAALLL